MTIRSTWRMPLIGNPHLFPLEGIEGRALSDFLDIELDRGEWISNLMGHGSGKSTDGRQLLGLDELPRRLLDLLAVFQDLSRHLIEVGRQLSNLVAGRNVNAVSEVTLGDLDGSLDESLQWTADALGEKTDPSAPRVNPKKPRLMSPIRVFLISAFSGSRLNPSLTAPQSRFSSPTRTGATTSSTGTWRSPVSILNLLLSRLGPV